MLSIDEHRARGAAREDSSGHKEIAALMKVTPTHSKDDNITSPLGFLTK